MEMLGVVSPIASKCRLGLICAEINTEVYVEHSVHISQLLTLLSRWKKRYILTVLICHEHELFRCI
jgi:uncharacterized membrane protein